MIMAFLTRRVRMWIFAAVVFPLVRAVYRRLTGRAGTPAGAAPRTGLLGLVDRAFDLVGGTSAVRARR